MDRSPPPPLAAAPPRFAVRMALALRRLLLRLADLVIPAPAVILDRTTGLGQTAALRAVSALGIADRLAAGPRTAADLAAEIGVDPDALHRTLRALAAVGIFRLRSDGRFAVNRLARALRREHPDSTGVAAEFFGTPASSSAWADLPRTLATGASAFPRLHGCSVWQWLEERPEESARFAATMGAVTRMYAGAVATRAVFADVRALLDVGGGRGTLLAEILRRHPEMRGGLLESPSVLETARGHLGPQGVLDRVALHAGSFFEGVPAGFDGVLLKQVLHDWDDERCLEILGACRRAMAPSARLFVVESIVERNEVHDFGPLVDLQMLVVCDAGRERGREELRALLARAGFSVVSFVPTASPVGIVVAVPS